MAGEYIFNLENLTKQHGAKTILEEVNLSFFFGARIGVIGGNGAGKTTLFKMITGQEAPTSGSLEIGESVDISYVDRVATHIMSFEGDSGILCFEGNYQAFHEWRKKQSGDAQPHRIRYRPIKN